MLIHDLPSLIAVLGDTSQADHDAIVTDSATVSLQTLARWVKRAGARLDDGSEAPVAVSTTDPVEHAVAVIGAMAAGRPALFIDPKHPDGLVADLVARCGASVAVGRDVAGLERLALAELTAGEPAAPVHRPGESIGSILLTSGSTGEPKMVLRSRQADLLAALNYTTCGFGVGPGDRYWPPTPHSSASFIGQSMGVLAAGATVVFGPFVPGEVASFIERHGITATHFVPTMVRLAHEREGLDHPAFRHLRAVLLGGEKLDEPTRNLVLEHFGDAVRVAYGATEVPQIAIGFADAVRERPDTVGAPYAMHQVKVVEVGGTAVLGTGEEGEVLMRGGDMFTGYHGDEPVGDWYESGDLGFVDADGYLYITGRASNLVKVGGNRVSTEEVATALRRLDGVANAAVIALDDATWTTRLEAFVVSPAGLTAEELDARLRADLPAYKVPRAFHLLDELPTDASGKVSQTALQRRASA